MEVRAGNEVLGWFSATNCDSDMKECWLQIVDYGFNKIWDRNNVGVSHYLM